MQSHLMRRRLIVNADDFGRSASINEAVVRAHQEGILTTASLMVNEPGFEEAVELARNNPGLGVGLHLTLLCGHAALSPKEIPGLVDGQGKFSSDPVTSGLRYFARRSLKEQLRAEIDAQFGKFHSSGLSLDHVNGHLHLHLHPTIFPILMENAERWGIRRVRWSYDPFWINFRLARGRWLYRIAHACVSKGLCGLSRGKLDATQMKYTRRVFGMLQDGRVDESFVLGLVGRLPAGDSELYSHPSVDEFKHELAALVSPAVRELIQAQEIELIRYQDL